MSDKEIVRKILAALEDAGVKLTEEQSKSLKDELAELKLAPSGSGLKDGQIAVDEEHLSGLKKDLKDKNTQRKELKESLAKLEDERDTLKAALDAGDSQNAKLATKYKTEFEKTQPIMKRLMDGVVKRWDSAAGKIPEAMKAQFKFADDEKGEEGKLSDEDYLSNVGKLEEYIDIGALKLEGDSDETPPPGVPKPGKLPDKTKPDTDKMTPEQKLETIYKFKPGEKAAETKP